MSLIVVITVPKRLAIIILECVLVISPELSSFPLLCHADGGIHLETKRIHRVIVAGIEIIIVKPTKRYRCAPEFGRICAGSKHLIRLQTRRAERYQTD